MTDEVYLYLVLSYTPMLSTRSDVPGVVGNGVKQKLVVTIRSVELVVSGLLSVRFAVLEYVHRPERRMINISLVVMIALKIYWMLSVEIIEPT